MIKLDIDLKNNKVWYRRSDGAYPHLHEPMAWLVERDCHHLLTDEGKGRADAIGYSGYRYGSSDTFRTVPGTFVICYTYGDIRNGPDPHLYNEPHRVYGPNIGHYIFDDSDVDLATMFKLVWC